MPIVRGPNDRSSSRLRVFREEELRVDDDLDFGEEPTSPSQRFRIAAAVDPLEQTDITPASRTRPTRITEPLPPPRPPGR